MEKRLILLPLVWIGAGLGEVLVLKFLLNGISVVIPTVVNDKPIGGALLPFLGFSTAVTLVVAGTSLYSLGYWEPNLSSKKSRADIIVLAVLVTSIILVFYSPLALFPLILAGLYFLAGNIE